MSRPSSRRRAPALPERPARRGEGLRPRPPAFRYLAFHKPLDVLCQFTDEQGRPTLADFIRVPEVYPVGRLDADSEGLLLLTDDGVLKSRLAEPRFKQPKAYLVQVEGIPSPEAVARLREGVVIQGGPARAVRAEIVPGEPALPPRPRPIRYRRDIPTCWMRIVLTEGRNRQVRHMTAAVGHPTLRLVRVAIGTVDLGDLEPGTWRWLEPGEVAALRRACGLDLAGPGGGTSAPG